MDELNFEELEAVGGNDALHQVMALATPLFESGFSKEEVEKVVSRQFDLTNPVLRDGFDNLSNKYAKRAEASTKQM